MPKVELTRNQIVNGAVVKAGKVVEVAVADGRDLVAADRAVLRSTATAADVDAREVRDGLGVLTPTPEDAHALGSHELAGSSTDIEEVDGIGPKTAEKLRKAGFLTVGDLLRRDAPAIAEAAEVSVAQAETFWAHAELIALGGGAPDGVDEVSGPGGA